jgi:hypothetical protein
MMFDSSWIKHFPLLIAGATFSTVLFEVYFPVLVWFKPLRKWVLAVGCALHAGIGLSVGLVFFSFAMVSTYVVFLEPEWLKEKARRLGVSERFF